VAVRLSKIQKESAAVVVLRQPILSSENEVIADWSLSSNTANKHNYWQLYGFGHTITNDLIQQLLVFCRASRKSKFNFLLLTVTI